MGKVGESRIKGRFCCIIEGLCIIGGIMRVTRATTNLSLNIALLCGCGMAEAFVVYLALSIPWHFEGSGRGSVGSRNAIFAQKLRAFRTEK